MGRLWESTLPMHVAPTSIGGRRDHDCTPQGRTTRCEQRVGGGRRDICERGVRPVDVDLDRRPNMAGRPSLGGAHREVERECPTRSLPRCQRHPDRREWLPHHERRPRGLQRLRVPVDWRAQLGEGDHAPREAGLGAERDGLRADLGGWHLDPHRSGLRRRVRERTLRSLRVDVARWVDVEVQDDQAGRRIGRGRERLEHGHGDHGLGEGNVLFAGQSALWEYDGATGRKVAVVLGVPGGYPSKLALLANGPDGLFGIERSEGDYGNILVRSEDVVWNRVASVADVPVSSTQIRTRPGWSS